MTDKLKQEAKEWCKSKNLTPSNVGYFTAEYCEMAYIAGAEPREKRIEKMKCGQNCKHSYLYQEDRKCKFTYCDCTNCKDKWELKE